MKILLLISDTFRYDNLFAYGGEHTSLAAEMPVRTPHLDSFAAERAVSVDKMFMSSFPTIPHRTDTITGRFGWPWHGWQNLSASSKNRLTATLGASGYVSQLIADCPHLFKHGFNLPFDAAHLERGQEGDIALLHMNDPLEPVAQPRRTIRSQPMRLGGNLADLSQWIVADRIYEDQWFAPRTGAQVARWLERNYKHPDLFLWVDFFDPHEPWDPPEYLVERYDPDYDGPPMIFPTYGRVDGILTEPELRNMRAHYCALAEMVDRAIGRIFQKLDDLRMWDDTIVVFTSDHGTSLGEHDRTGKTNIHDEDDRIWPIYPEVAHVPFLVAAPGLQGGRRIDTLCQTPDIAPTLLDLAGIANPETPEPMHGKSIAAQLRGQSDAPIRDIAITAASPPAKVRSGEAPAATTPLATDGRWAYVPIGPDGSAELYDLSTDPYAERNIHEQHPDRAAAMRAAFAKWLEEHDAPGDIAEAFRLC